MFMGGEIIGYVIYHVGLLGELDKALTMYSTFEGFDEQDLAGTLTSVNAQVQRLPQCYSDLWDLSKTGQNSYDEEAYEILLTDDALRETFYQRLAEYSKTLAIAHATKGVITEKMDEDPASYEKFSKLIQQAIDDFRARRISDLAYVEKVTGKCFFKRIWMPKTR